MLKLPPEQARALLGQAATVLAELDRQPELPVALRLEIEEAVEAAWEIAYRRDKPRKVVVDFRAVLEVRKERDRTSGCAPPRRDERPAAAGSEG